MDLLAILLMVAALVGGLAIGWLVGRSEAAQARAERDARTSEFRQAIVDLAAATERAKAADQIAIDRAATIDELRAALDLMRNEREEARTKVATLTAQAEAFESRLVEQQRHQAEARETMLAQFRDLAGSALTEAQRQFLERADARFRQSEELAKENLGSLLQPVKDRLSQYEQTVKEAETERKSAFDHLKGELEGLRSGQERVSSEAAKLVNALRNAPKARGRWGEEALRNVLEMCGLAEHTDFETEVSVDRDPDDDESRRRRPDAVVRLPGGGKLIVDAKVSLNAYQDAFDAETDIDREIGLKSHARAIRDHVKTLGDKAYQSRFEETVDFVVMFVPGEHYLSAALQYDNSLWQYAFDRKVLLATPTNLVAIAKTIAMVWRQEKLAQDAVAIGRLGKEIHDRLATTAEHLRLVGTGLSSAVQNYNKFVGSFERNLMTSGRRMAALNIEMPSKSLPDLNALDVAPVYGNSIVAIEDQAADGANSPAAPLLAVTSPGD